MNILPLHSNELQRLDQLKANSPESEFNWVKARFRSINSELIKLQSRFDNDELNSSTDVENDQ